MAYLIANNAFSTDSYGLRATRLHFLSNSIDSCAIELSITGEVLVWAQNVDAVFDEAQVKQTAELGEKNDAFQKSQEADKVLYERYVVLKELLQARYDNDYEKLRIYGLTGPIPAGRTAHIDKAEELIEGNVREIAVGDPNVLPANMIDSFQTLITDAKDKYYEAGIERLEAEEASEQIKTLFDEDSAKLRSIYQWIVAHWGKKNPQLIGLGFVPVKSRRGGRTPDAPQNLSYAQAMNTFSWDLVESATSYQLAYRVSGSNDSWNNAYNGSGINVVFDSGNGIWEFKVRARNAAGYGDWSDEIEVDIGI